jgi:hypothetical protein
MAEYIEREAFMEFWNKEFRHLYPNDKYLVALANFPTAEVVEVRHGEWLHTEEPLGWRDVDCIECSSCHESWIMDDDLCLDDYKDGWKYCPNCGAKMDGKGDVITCLNCNHLMFSDCYGECNKQLRIVNPSDTCKYAEPKDGKGEGE